MFKRITELSWAFRAMDTPDGTKFFIDLKIDGEIYSVREFNQHGYINT